MLAVAGAPAYVISVALASFGLRRSADARRDEGRALTGWLRSINRAPGAILVSTLAILAILGTVGVWILGTSVGDLPLVGAIFSQGFDSGAAISIGLAGLLLLARFFPLNPRRLNETVGGALEIARVGLDIIYDVMSYVREGSTAARFSVVSRYRALLAQVVQIGPDEHGGGGYDGVVFAAHSQGTIYTCATLFGDDARRPTIYPLERGGEPRAAEGLAAMRTVSFLSFGSPIRQTYDRFFPDQYSHWYPQR